MNRPAIADAACGNGLVEITVMFQEYADGLGVDLAFQDFARELATLPGPYAAPRGCILLARIDGEPAGCVALKPLGPDICEMKRLYVREGFRKTGLGRLLAEAVVQAARSRGYRKMRLDTLATMAAAIRLYQSLGFRRIDPYYFNPLESPLFFELDLGLPG